MAIIAIEPILDGASRPRLQDYPGKIPACYMEQALRRAQGKDAGTRRLRRSLRPTQEGGIRPGQAARRRRNHAFVGGDPAECVATEIKVSETRYGAWPSEIRKAFEAARTVKTGKPTFRDLVWRNLYIIWGSMSGGHADSGQETLLSSKPILFVDSITDLARQIMTSACQQPEAFFERTDEPDIRSASSLLGREVIHALKLAGTSAGLRRRHEAGLPGGIQNAIPLLPH